MEKCVGGFLFCSVFFIQKPQRPLAERPDILSCTGHFYGAV